MKDQHSTVLNGDVANNVIVANRHNIKLSDPCKTVVNRPSNWPVNKPANKPENCLVGQKNIKAFLSLCPVEGEADNKIPNNNNKKFAEIKYKNTLQDTTPTSAETTKQQLSTPSPTQSRQKNNMYEK